MHSGRADRFLVNPDDVWIGLKWIGEVSYLGLTYKALAVNEFTNLTFVCPEYGARPRALCALSPPSCT